MDTTAQQGPNSNPPSKPEATLNSSLNQPHNSPDKNSSSSSSQNEEAKHNELSNVSRNSTVFLRSRTSHARRQASDKKSKPYDSDDENKLHEMDRNCRAQFLYNVFYNLPELSDHLGGYIKVIVLREHLTNQNPALLKRDFWGNEFYTSDSDIVCILQHCGQIILKEDLPDFPGIAVYFKVSKSRSNYASHFKNGLRSRKTQSFDGHSLKFELAVPLESVGTQDELSKLAAPMSTKKRGICRKNKHPSKASSSHKDMSIVFSLSGEPINKFDLGEFVFKGNANKPIAEALKTEILYIETLDKRFEISCRWKKVPADDQTGGKLMKSDIVETEAKFYRVAEVKDPLFKDLDYMRKSGIPLPAPDVKYIFKDLKWDELLWGNTSLKIRDTFKVKNINGYIFHQTEDDDEEEDE
ncbi:unnamed protein product [Moneuplotes crassus]|uniref:Uncharacterized protein n=1 Tax=Euplotes crassus TaxID=5936 RepID=A0AAD1UI78_EUPCR|nr:unnamed protein product [Moneuplotes crassus]